MKAASRPPTGRQLATPPRKKAITLVPPDGLALPHERDESNRSTAAQPDPMMVQAQKDIDAGLVDTDMRATAGLDAEQRVRLVPGPGGKPYASGR